MKTTIILLFVFCVFHLKAQQNQLDVTFNPLGLALVIMDGIHIDCSLEYQIAEDVGIEASYIISNLPFNNNYGSPIPPNQAIWKMFSIGSDLYLHPKRGLDRWYLNALIAVEKSKGTFRFRSNQFQTKVSRYHVGLGLGYKRVFNKTIIVKISASLVREFANKYSDSFTIEKPDIAKISQHSSGIRFNVGIGYRFQWEDGFLKR